MTQEKIIQIIQKKKMIFTKGIQQELRITNESRESIKHCLKQLRKFDEIGFVLVTFDNKKRLAKRFPIIKEYDDKGFIRRPCFLYFAK